MVKLNCFRKGYNMKVQFMHFTTDGNYRFTEIPATIDDKFSEVDVARSFHEYGFPVVVINGCHLYTDDNFNVPKEV